MHDTAETLAALAARPGILGYLLRVDAEFRQRFAAFVAGDTRVCWVAGEPANGKSTLVGDIYLALRSLTPFPLAGVAYDPVHAMLYECLGLPLPEGETPEGVRRVVSDLLRDTLLYALDDLPLDTRVLVEAPLIDVRGEAALAALAARGHALHVVALHNPHVWWRVHDAGARVNALSARVEAMNAIRGKLLARLHAPAAPAELGAEQEERLRSFWERWRAQDPGQRMVLTWQGPASDAAAAETDRALARDPVPGVGLFPEALAAQVRARAAALLAELPDGALDITRAGEDLA